MLIEGPISQLVTPIPATIIVLGKAVDTSCMVTAIFPTGARLSASNKIPQIFWLCMQGDIRLHCATVVWQKDKDIGVEFRCGHDRAWWQHSRVLARAISAGTS
jgi:hypothetical protein